MDCSRARTRNPAEWLETCPDFSQTLANQVHEWVLNWEPDLTESIKWNNLRCFGLTAWKCAKWELHRLRFSGIKIGDPGFPPEIRLKLLCEPTWHSKQTST